VNTPGNKYAIVSPRYNFNTRDEVYYLSLIYHVSKGLCRDIGRPVNLHSKEIVNYTCSTECVFTECALWFDHRRPIGSKSPDYYFHWNSSAEWFWLLCDFWLNRVEILALCREWFSAHVVWYSMFCVSFFDQKRTFSIFSRNEALVELKRDKPLSHGVLISYTLFNRCFKPNGSALYFRNRVARLRRREKLVEN